MVTVDAIVRTVIRLTVTRKRLLEWETAAQAELGTEKKTPVDVYLRLTPWLSAATAVTLAACRPRALLVALPVLVAWACSKTLARWLNRSLPAGKTQITAEDEALLRGAALRTWRFFRQFSNAAANWLVPDNVQQEPPVAAPRISPTNLGLLLDARLAAYELGYLTVAEFASETEKSLARAARLTRHNGHFLNWYDTRTLAPLEPLFVSTVDSGNLAACLWALKQGCLQMSRQPLFRPADWRGIRDHVEVMDELASAGAAPEEAVSAIKRLRERMKSLRDGSAAWIRELPAVERALLELATTLASETTGSGELGWWAAESLERLRQARALIESFAPWLWPADRELLGQLGPEDVEQLTLESLPRVLADLDAKLQRLSEDETTDEAKKLAARALRATLPERLREAEALSQKLAALAEQAGAWVEQMDFRFLYNERRKVLSVGYDVRGERLEASCYELLASEARTAAFVAIAKGDVPQESWLHLGRAHVLVKGERVLLSWSGTMFEYLMPALWMRNYPNTILEQSLRAAVRCQQAAGKKEQRPWGISEAASSQRDAAGHYQYRAFGLPALGIRPAASDDDRVVSPYATFLALAVDAPGAVKNLRHMKEMNWLGAFGFYEAADFTPARVTSLAGHEPVRCWMAHHQGMSLLAVTNLLRDSVIQELFHAEALVAGTERLLDERLPVAVHVEPADEPQRRERKGPCKDGKDQDRAAPLDALPRAPAAGEAPESRNSRWEDLSAESCGSRRR
ncbi:MAG: hypothetical protein DMG24_16725 [Acidobacteria bacterium]|nr:MAG: hypothetical protein DMG24_16725 [Acidobacteriota bacterium]